MTTDQPIPPLTDGLVQAAAAELTTPECPWHETCAGGCEAAEAHARAVLNAVRPDLLAEVDRLRAELERVQDARAAETDEYTRQLRELPGWCRACPPRCASCLGPDCECYEHEDATGTDTDNEPTPDDHQPLTAGELRDYRVHQKELAGDGVMPLTARKMGRLISEVYRLGIERDRARSIAIRLEQQLAAVEALGRNWATAPHDVTSVLDRHLQEEYGTTAIAHCGQAVLTALGLSSSGEGAG